MSAEQHQGVNSAMLASMSEHSGGMHPNGHMTGSPFDNNLVGGKIGIPGTEGSIDLGLHDNMDTLTKLEGALDHLDLKKVDHLGGNINAFQGMGTVSNEFTQATLDKMGPHAQFQIPQNFGAPIPPKDISHGPGPDMGG